MKKFYSYALSIAMMAVATVSASAEGIHLGYCDGKMPFEGIGQSGKDATIDAAIRLTPEMLAPYQTCQITSLYVGFPELANALPTTITAWLRAEKDGNNVVEAVVTPQKGWMTIQFAAPVNISNLTNGAWVGFKFTQENKLNVLAIGGETEVEDACWVGKNGKWSDFKRYGVLPIEAIVEGEDLIQRDLKLLSCSTLKFARLGDKITLRGKVKNTALEEATSVVVKATLEDKDYCYTLPEQLAYRDEASFFFDIPLSADDMEERDVDIDVELLWSATETDQNVVDNHTTLHVTLLKDVYYRKLVCEEATGGWCGFCVRGIVGLRQMRAMYPETFIGIGIHNGDPYEVANYDSFVDDEFKYIESHTSEQAGYPSCFINRDHKLYDPNTDELEKALTDMDPIASIGLDITATYDGEQLHFIANVHPVVDMEQTDYRLAFVVLEDSLPISQHNYYAGGGYGPMDGFENLPGTCNVIINDVARAVYPSAYGVEGSVPATLIKGETYTYTYDVPMCQYVEAKNIAVVALLIDNTTGNLENGAKCEYIDGLTPDVLQLQQLTVPTELHAIYNLQGQAVAEPQKGLNIVGGRVIFTR